MEIGEKLGSNDHQKIRFQIKWDMKLPPIPVQMPDLGHYEGLYKIFGSGVSGNPNKGFKEANLFIFVT